jgi:hypothetical protein
LTIENSQNEPPASSKEFMLAEHQRIKELFTENEKDGNTRINILITLTTSSFGAFGITKQLEDKGDYGIFFIPVLISLFFLGIFILRRLIHRNITTDEYKVNLDKIRSFFELFDPTLKKDEYSLYEHKTKKDYLERRLREWKKWHSPGTGGYAQITVLLNTFIFGLFFFILLSSIINYFISFNQNDSISDNVIILQISNFSSSLERDNQNNNDFLKDIILLLGGGLSIGITLIITLIIYYKQYQYVKELYKNAILKAVEEEKRKEKVE